MKTARSRRNWRLELLAYAIAAALVTAALLFSSGGDPEPQAPGPDAPAAAPQGGVNP